jgi:hypothetical protein
MFSVTPVKNERLFIKCDVNFTSVKIHHAASSTVPEIVKVNK